MFLINYFSSLNPLAFTNALPGNIAQGLIWGIMALGVYITFRLLDFADLTVDGSFATGGAVTVMLTVKGYNIWVALLCACIAGLLAGLCTGLLHTKLGIPPILAGILTQIALYSINLNIMDRHANQALSVDKYSLILSSRNLTSAIVTGLLFAAVLIIVLYWYFGTEQGSAIRATGCNPAMSRAQGINIDNMKLIGLSISNAIVALSGGLLAQYSGFADVNMGRGGIVIGLAAVIIGEVLGDAVLGKRMDFKGRLIFVVIGGIIYYIVIGIVLWLKMPSDDLKLFTAIIVAIFLVPMVRALELPVSEPFCKALQEKWCARYPKDPFYLGTYDTIASGFRKKFLGLCFITTAVCQSRGLPDDCAELTAFRAFRDGYLRACPDGEALIEEYYRIAPGIVSCIDVCSDRAAKYAAIRDTWLSPCYRDLLAGRLEPCKARYVDMVRSLEKEYLS